MKRKPARLLHEIEGESEFVAAFYGRHGVTPIDALKRALYMESLARNATRLPRWLARATGKDSQ